MNTNNFETCLWRERMQLYNFHKYVMKRHIIFDQRIYQHSSPTSSDGWLSRNTHEMNEWSL